MYQWVLTLRERTRAFLDKHHFSMASSLFLGMLPRAYSYCLEKVKKSYFSYQGIDYKFLILCFKRQFLYSFVFRKKAFFVDLFVRVSNKVAVDMYRKLGYTIYRTVLQYYSGDPDEDAYGESLNLHILTFSPCHHRHLELVARTGLSLFLHSCLSSKTAGRPSICNPASSVSGLV